MKVAVIGQSAFGADVYKSLLSRGHEVVGVFTIPDDSKGREDPLAAAAAANGHPVFKLAKWRSSKAEGGGVLPDVLEKYKALGAELNVLAFVTQFIPMEISNACKHGSIIYHPSLLPRHRGASAINWALMEGDEKTGLTIFWADEGLDTGPILLQRECQVEPDDTVISIYKRFLFPEGVKALGDAVDLIAAGNAPRLIQPEEGASYDPLWKDPAKAKVDLNQPGQKIHNFIRGNDRVPGAWVDVKGKRVSLFSSHLVKDGEDVGEVKAEFDLEGTDKKAKVTSDAVYFEGTDGAVVRIGSVKVDGKPIDLTSLSEILNS